MNEDITVKTRKGRGIGESITVGIFHFKKFRVIFHARRKKIRVFTMNLKTANSGDFKFPNLSSKEYINDCIKWGRNSVLCCSNTGRIVEFVISKGFKFGRFNDFVSVKECFFPFYDSRKCFHKILRPKNDEENLIGTFSFVDQKKKIVKLFRYSTWDEKVNHLNPIPDDSDSMSKKAKFRLTPDCNLIESNLLEYCLFIRCTKKNGIGVVNWKTQRILHLFDRHKFFPHSMVSHMKPNNQELLICGSSKEKNNIFIYQISIIQKISSDEKKESIIHFSFVGKVKHDYPVISFFFIRNKYLIVSGTGYAVIYDPTWNIAWEEIHQVRKHSSMINKRSYWGTFELIGDLNKEVVSLVCSSERPFDYSLGYRRVQDHDILILDIYGIDFFMKSKKGDAKKDVSGRIEYLIEQCNDLSGSEAIFNEEIVFGIYLIMKQFYLPKSILI